MSEYTLHNALERASIEDYVELFNKAYGANEKLTKAYLKWLYQANPDGQAVGVDAFLGDELAAHYITVPRSYVANGEEVKGLLSLNTATHPNHQRRGLFKRLANATYERGSELGFGFVIGVANAQSVHGFVNGLGFETLGQVRLALFQRPRPHQESSAHLATNSDWLRWRLSNPSAEYFTTKGGSGRLIVHARRGPISFAIGNVSSHIMKGANLQLPHRAFAGLPSLTPIFPKPSGLLVPLKLQPSPWHVILRPLKAPIDSMRQVEIDGLAMDTF